MCAFDPNLKYVPCATPESPGIKIDKLDMLRKTFTDIWPCYLEQHFPIDNGTMFRFPLRYEEMAQVSKICPESITFERLTSLVDEFQSEILEALLFVNHVKEISIHEVDKDDGSIKLDYQVKAEISEDDEKKRQEFSSYVKFIGNQLQSGEISISEIAVQKVSYVLNLKDSHGINQKWLVVQQIGFESKENILQAEDVGEAFKRGELGLLPRGGVASLISTSKDKPPGKAFCFLPLPFKTGLPVHINGHFALEHEARRNLWRSEKGDYRSKWNEILVQQVVAPCYVVMLEEIRKFINLPLRDGNKTILKESRENIEFFLENYASSFPPLNVDESYWKLLAKEVYRQLSNKQSRVLPVLRHNIGSGDCPRPKQKGLIEWLPPIGEGQEKAFFDNMEPKNVEQDKTIKAKLKAYFVLRDTFLAVGLNLVCMPISLYYCFVDSGMSVNEISPKEVISFFHTYSSNFLTSMIRSLPLPLKRTPFKNTYYLLLVLNYCKKEANFYQNLHGLPLLLTEDNQLRVFDKSEPVYFSCFYDLAPASHHMFLHHSLSNSAFRDQEKKENMPNVFKVFDVAAFAVLLPTVLDQASYRSSDKYVIWNPKVLNTKPPFGQWIWYVWRFFESVLRPLLNQLDDDSAKRLCYENTKHLNYKERRDVEENERKRVVNEKKQLIQESLEPVEQWCLLPATEVHNPQPANQKPECLEEKHFLVPLKMAETVLSSGYSATALFLKSAIQSMSLPELNCRIVGGSDYFTSETSCDIPQRLVSSLTDGRLFLSVLLQKFKFDASLFQKFQGHGCKAVLQHFDDHIDDFQPNDVGDLKSLPLYPTIHGDYISIGNKPACVLSGNIPKHDMDIWEGKSGIVFLIDDPRFKKLYNFLECDSKSEVDVYCDIIFESFQDMSKDARFEHLKFVRGLLHELEHPRSPQFSTLSETEKKDLQAESIRNKERLIQALQKLKFDLGKDGSLKQASCFYDKNVNVFAAMLPEEQFPAKPFCEDNWLLFLRKIGLIHKVANELFLAFANEVAAEGTTNPTINTEEKSKTLVDYLFSMENVATSPILENVKHVSFILHHKIDDQYKELHPPFSSSQYICFQGSVAGSGITKIAWSSANILPSYANISYRSFKPNYEENHHLNDEGNFTQEIFSRLGILKCPTCEMVVRHCIKICTRHCKGNVKQTGEDSKRDVLNDVMRGVYRFLQANFRKHAYVIESGLQNIRCVLVDNGTCFVYPKQVVADLMKEDEISPYLFKVPLQFAAFADLFQNLGATDTVTSSQYAMVLDCIHMECKDNKMNLNEIGKAFKATKGLFETIAKKNDVADIQTLYLPGLKHNPEDPTLISVFSRKSTEVFFNDAPHFKDRLNGFEGFTLVKLKDCDLNVDNDDRVVNLLPKPLRPCMLSSVVHEALCEDDENVTFSSAAQDLKNILTSSEFCFGLIRLVRHADHERNMKTNDDIVSKVRKSLSCINVFSVQGLRTRLVYKSSTIPGSEAEVPCFEERKDEGTQEVWNIYVEHNENVTEYFSTVAEIIDRTTGHLLGNKLVHLPMMLLSPLGKISSLLDRLKIREDNSYLTTDPSIFPKPGQFIHIEDHHLLDNAFTFFNRGEYVGYELDDPSLRGEDGTPTYIYAIILESVSDRYKIDIGTEHIEVDPDQLYKFYRRKQEGEGMEIEVFTGEENEQVRPDNLDEAKRQVRETLENAWNLPEERKKRKIKRLYLTWHPDKNPGNEEFCTEVFKFLKSEIERLEKGLSPDQPEEFWRSPYSSGGYRGGFSDFFHRWSGYAGSHRRYRASYEDRGGSTSYHRSNPQPGEASRWYRQASADFKAASNDIEEYKQSYEWACFKCQQSAEKALKAAQYSQDADKSSTHDLPEIARSLGDIELQLLASSLENLLGESTRMRYPDRVCYPRIPHDIYTKDTANRALEITEQILVIVKTKFVH